MKHGTGGNTVCYHNIICYVVYSSNSVVGYYSLNFTVSTILLFLQVFDFAILILISIELATSSAYPFNIHLYNLQLGMYVASWHVISVPCSHLSLRLCTEFCSKQSAYS